MVPTSKENFVLHLHDKKLYFRSRINQVRLLLSQTLQQQGITSGSALSCTYVPMSIHDAWCFLQGHPVCFEEFALEGMKQLKGVRCLEQIRYLPKSLETLEFHDKFNETLKGIHFPPGLQRLTLGYDFDQSLQGLKTFPESLQVLTLGKSFDQTLTDVDLPNLQRLAFGGSFCQSLEGFESITSYRVLIFWFKLPVNQLYKIFP